MYTHGQWVDLLYIPKSSSFLAHLYKSTGRAIAVTTALTSALLKMLKILVTVFKSIYLINLWMDLVDILPGVRCLKFYAVPS